MDYELSLAFAAVSKSLCIFTGAGFSKAMAPDAPSWLEMLEEACSVLKDADDAVEQLSKAREIGLPLEDCAQALDLMFRREGQSLRAVLANQIASLKIDETCAKSCKEFLLANKSVSWITTNYDSLLEQIIGSDSVVVNYPGKPLAVRDGCVQDYHIHGYIANPENLVVTTTDYYNFINRIEYFAQKTLTLLSENTVLVLGYSLSDPNLKAIFNKLKSMGMRSLQRGNIYYVTRDAIPRFVRDHYEASYGITVVDCKEIAKCFSEISSRLKIAEERFAAAEKGLDKVLNGKAVWKDDYLKLKGSIFHIFGVANVRGVDILDAKFVKMISDILDKKKIFSQQNGAWEQYEHLADWLIYLGSIMDIEGTALHDSYLDAVNHSMRTMTSRHTYGYSWYAFDVWKSKWIMLNLNNRIFIEKYVHLNMPGDVDAQMVVSQN